MNTCSWNSRIEAFHDGETAHANGVEEHLHACGDCREYLGMLQVISGGVAASRKEVEIADAQFRVFMDGIREKIEAPRAWWIPLLSRLSVMAAGMVLIVALGYILAPPSVRTWAGQLVVPFVSIDDDLPGSGINEATKGDIE